VDEDLFETHDWYDFYYLESMMNSNPLKLNGYKNFYTNTDKKNVPLFLTAAKFTGIKIIVHENAYDVRGNIVPHYSALIWGTLKRSKKQARLFNLYFDNLKSLYGLR